MTIKSDVLGMLASGKHLKLADLKKLVESKTQARPVVNNAGDPQPQPQPQVRITLFQTLYSNQTLTVQCQAVPADASSAGISMLLVQAESPTSGTIFCSGSATADDGTTPAVGTNLKTYCSTQIFDPLTDGSSISVGYFGFITNAQGQSFVFEDSQTVDVGGSSSAQKPTGTW